MSDAPVRIKKFYKSVSVKNNNDGLVLLLDGKTARTKKRLPLCMPNEALANAVKEEWKAQGDHIELQSMPITALISSSLDLGEEGARANRDEVLNYLGSDLLCYRAEEPMALSTRQADVWDPYLSWLKDEFGAVLSVTSGVIAVEQSEESSNAIKKALDPLPGHVLLGLKNATTIAGSAVLALALWRRFRPPEEIFNASLVDEHFQRERWGDDKEALDREARLRQDFLTVGRFLSLGGIE